MYKHVTQYSPTCNKPKAKREGVNNEDKKKELEGLEGTMGLLLSMTVHCLIKETEAMRKELEKINARLDKLEGDKNNG